MNIRIKQTPQGTRFLLDGFTDWVSFDAAYMRLIERGMSNMSARNALTIPDGF